MDYSPYWEDIANRLMIKEGKHPKSWEKKEFNLFRDKLRRRLVKICEKEGPRSKKLELCGIRNSKGVLNYKNWEPISWDTFKQIFKEKEGGKQSRILNQFAIYFGYEDFKDYTKENKIPGTFSEKKIRINDAIILEYIDFLNVNSRIGFHKDEKLSYLLAHGKWLNSKNYKYNIIAELNYKEHKNFIPETYEELYDEGDLFSFNSLIEEYLNYCKTESLTKSTIFVISDYGKGKSVLLKQLAFGYSKKFINYIEGQNTYEKYFPIYVNLRDAQFHFSNQIGGVLYTYLKRKHELDLLNDYFQQYSILFFVDAFDEVGAIESRQLIKEIYKIYDIKPPNVQFVIIIASRPKQDLENILQNQQYCSFKKEYSGNDKVLHYLYLFGFSNEQFDSFIITSLESSSKKFEMASIDYSISDNLLGRGVLKEQEIRKPLFAYILFKLIENGFDINRSSLSKLSLIRIHLSLINVLTIEAKHIDDPDIKTFLDYNTTKPTFLAQVHLRSVLQIMAVLWMLDRINNTILNNTKSLLTKRNIKKVLLDRKKNKYSLPNAIIDKIEFLSNSYSGDDGISFRHQTFAEVLLAEHYLKIFLHFAFTSTPISEIRKHLLLGQPTIVTIRFFKQLLKLLRLSVNKKISESVISARELLSPLITTLTIDKSLYLHTEILSTDWYQRNRIKFEQTEASFPDSETLISSWPIGEDEIAKIIHICKNIINSESLSIYQPTISARSILNVNVSFVPFTNITNHVNNEDKWLALLTGNELYNDETENKFFSSNINANRLFDLIRPFRYYNNTDQIKLWGRTLFRGLNMKTTDISERSFENLDWSGIDFSYSYFKDFLGKMINMEDCIFNHSVFENFEVEHCNLANATFDNIRIIKPDFSDTMDGYSGFQIHKSCIIGSSQFVPELILRLLISNNSYIMIPTFITKKKEIDNIFNCLSGLIIWLFKEREITIKDFKKGFHFMSDELENVFLKRLKVIINE